MATRPKNSEKDTLELYRVALENAETQPEISSIMVELGYDTAKISEGKTLLSETRQKYDVIKQRMTKPLLLMLISQTKKHS